MMVFRAGLVLAAAALGLVTIGSTFADARDIKIVRKPVAQVAAAPAQSAPAKIENAPATVAAITAPVSPCARKVKVVYTGYGEANRASCDAN